MKRLRMLVGAFMVLTACGGGSLSTPPTSARWTIGSYSVLVPEDWTVREDPDENGFNVIDAPSGGGGIFLIEIAERGTPSITPGYALDHGARGVDAAGLSAVGLTAAAVGPSHYSVTSEGESEGRLVVANVHVFAPNRIVVGYFNSPQLDDPLAPVARQILASVSPEGTS